MREDFFDALSGYFFSTRVASLDAEDSAGAYRYENPKTGEVFIYSRKGVYRKDGTALVYRGKAEEEDK